MRVEFVGPIERYNPDFDLADVFLHLDDGRTFAFDVATPNYIYWCMDNEGLDHYVGIRPVLVKRLTPEIVERALRAVVDAGEETLNAHGVLTGEHDEKVQLTIGKDEALILFELLTDFFDEPAVVLKDNADRMALSRLGGSLDKALVGPFLRDYKEIVESARKRLIEPWRPANETEHDD